MVQVSKLIVDRLLQEPSADIAVNRLIDMVLYWIFLLDMKDVTAYLEETIRDAHLKGNSDRTFIPNWDELKQRPELELRKEFISWFMKKIYQNGFDKVDIITHTEYSPAKPLNDFAAPAQMDEAGIARELSRFTTGEVERLLCDASVQWVLNLNPDKIKAEAIATKHHLKDWQYPNLFSYVFYMIYLSITEDLLQGTFTEDFAKSWTINNI